MGYYMLTGGTIPSFGHSPLWIDYRRGTYSTSRAGEARSHRVTPETSRKTSGPKAAADPIMQSPCKSHERTTFRRILGISKLSNRKSLSSRFTRTCDVHSTALSPYPPESCSRAPALARDVRKKEAQKLVCKTRVLESILPLPQDTSSPESGDSDELPPQYATFDPYPFSGNQTSNRDQPKVSTSSAGRNKGLGFISNKLSKRVSNVIKHMSASARSAETK